MEQKKKAKKLKVRPKKKSGVKTKTQKKKAVIMKKTSSWRTLTLESEEVQHLLLGRPKIFKDPEELLKLFNTYILTCLEKKRKYEIVPVKTVEGKSITLETPVNDDLTAEEELTEAKVDKKEAGKQEITNKLESKYEIKETIDRKTTPSIGGFLIFLGGMSYNTWANYKNNEEFKETVEEIDNYLESLIIEQTSKGKYNSQIAQFVLNVKYNRIPKSKVDQTIQGDVFNESDFIKD